ncbi:MAG: VWA domain-containing protein [Rhodoblastus sp.]
MSQLPDKAQVADKAVDDFLARAARTPVPARGRGRLIFALDATMSRQPTWDLAQSLQQRMFEAAEGFGGLDVQLVYFRGLSECRASRFVSQGTGLGAVMSRIDCRGGVTQIEKVLRHTSEEARAAPVAALVYVGDAMEENADRLCALAGELGLRGVKAFMFHEGADGQAGAVFQEIARLSGGAYATFDAGAPQRLAGLLGAAAAYAAGGHAALEAQANKGNGDAKRLIAQIGGAGKRG